MSEIARRHTLAVLTIVALTSFHVAVAQKPPRHGAFRDNPAWTVDDGVLTTQVARQRTGAGHARHAGRQRHRLRIPRARGLRAPRCMFRAATPSSSWATATGVPFQSALPRAALRCGLQQGRERLRARGAQRHRSRRSVIFENPSPGAVWRRRRLARTRVRRGAAGAVLAAQRAPRARGFHAAEAAQGVGRRHQREGPADLVALGKKAFTQLGCEACHLVEQRQRRRELGPEPVRPVPRRAAQARGGRGRRRPSLPDQGRARIPAPLGARARRPACGRRERPDQGPALSTRDAGVRRRKC